MGESIFLADFVDRLQQQGRYTFTKKEALETLNCKNINLTQYVNRLLKKKRLLMPKRGFLVIIPTEYQVLGEVPASWYIHNLMSFEGIPYYVGLLTAASLHGASHQKPQEFQVLSSHQLRKVSVGNSSIRFLKKTHFSSTRVSNFKTPTGYMQVSSPALTAMDLSRYHYVSGYLSNVATVLYELGENIQERDLKIVLREENSTSISQRLGYLLEIAGHQRLSQIIYQWLETKAVKSVPLMVNKQYKDTPFSEKWRLFINENVEIDI
jgi:predicted transcriptional regulator of viral defense system